MQRERRLAESPSDVERRGVRRGYNGYVEKKIRVFRSFAEADAEDAATDARMTAEERIQIVIALRDRRHPDAAQQGLARVYRVTKLERS
jgi:hypothetical protein